MRVFTCLMVLFTASACTTTVEEVRQYGQGKNADMLVRAIEKNLHDNDQEDLVKAAVEELINVEGPEAWPYLNYRFERGFSEELIRYALQVTDPALDMTTLQIRLLDCLSKKEFPCAQRLLRLAGDLTIAADIFPENVTGSLEATMNVSRQIDQLTYLKDEIQDALDRYTRRRDKAQDEGNLYSMLYGNIIAQQSSNLYEIADNRGQRALLLTTQTSFERRGSFRLPVTELTEMPVTLKQEYGGFTQQWKVYRETDADNLKVAKKALSTVYALQDSIREARKGIRHFETQITRLDDSRMDQWSRLDSLFRETYTSFYANR